MKPIIRSLLLLSFILQAVSCIHTLGGSFKYKPNELRSKVSPGAQKLLEAAFSDIDSTKLLDYHTHLVGLGTKGSGAFVNQRMRTWYRVFDYIRYKVYFSASNVVSEENADEEFILRLIDLIQNIPGHGKYYLLSFDKHYNTKGEVILDKTEFYTPNEYTASIQQQYPQFFKYAISIHPYRKDALVTLEKWAKRGARLIKWLPNAMGIDPSHPLTEPYYKVMKKYAMVLLTHAGEEKAVHAEENQRYGNPLLLRKPLNMGVKVVVAHCASLGQGVDLDAKKPQKADNFDLFLRLMDDPKYKDLLYADISGMTQFNRLARPLQTMLDRKDLHSRLVNGSDYPLPAINIIIRTKDLVDKGFISSQEREYLNEIYNVNPLLFDFVVKRTIQSPNTGNKFESQVFYQKF